MARYSAEHKAQSRRKIVEAAARLFRKGGVEGTALPQVMAEAGMTVGGFYRHFQSKSDLLRAALAEALAGTRRFLERSPGRGRAWVAKGNAAYLSRAHLENVEGGCPLPALAAEVARAEPEVREVYDTTMRSMVDALEPRLGDANGDGTSGDESVTVEKPTARDRAWSLLALDVGALVLARAACDPKLADEILAAAKRVAVDGVAGPPAAQSGNEV